MPVMPGTTINLTCSLGDGIMWSREDGKPLPAGANITTNGDILTIPDAQPDDGGVYVCSVPGESVNFTLEITSAMETPTRTGKEEEGDSGVGTIVIIIVAAVGGGSLLLFLIVLIIAMCYFCSRCHRTGGEFWYLVPLRYSCNCVFLLPCIQE